MRNLLGCLGLVSLPFVGFGIVVLGSWLQQFPVLEFVIPALVIFIVVGGVLMVFLMPQVERGWGDPHA